jgi:L-alanine-DL-glutamate epimerase-like enolase superfamily enzyme
MNSGNLIINKIELFKSPIRLKEPFTISLGSFQFAENIIVRIITKDGLAGYGECSPFASINGETIDTCFIIGEKIAKNLIGENASDPPECLRVMDKAIFGNTSIKSAFDIAIYDIASQSAGLPLYRFLGGIKNKKLFTDYTISIGDPDKMAADAVVIKERGFRFIKVKVGNNGAADIKRISAIRKAIGNEIPLRIDANQGWGRDEAIDTLTALSEFNIQFCEEPVPRWMFMELALIRKRSPIKIMGDESCLDHHDAERLIGLSACDYFNVKLGKSSGITNAIKIIRLAESSGMKVQIGGFLESRLGFTASANLSFMSDCVEFSDFDSPMMMEEDPVTGGIVYGKGGEVIIPDTHGLGAGVDENYLKNLVSKRIE